MIMKKVIIPILAIAGMLSIASCQKETNNNTEALQREIDSLMLVNAHTKADYEHMILVMTEVQSALADIKSAEKILIINSKKEPLFLRGSFNFSICFSYLLIRVSRVRTPGGALEGLILRTYEPRGWFFFCA